MRNKKTGTGGANGIKGGAECKKRNWALRRYLSFVKGRPVRFGSWVGSMGNPNRFEGI